MALLHFVSLPQLLSDVSLLSQSASPTSLALFGRHLVSEATEIEALSHLILLKRMLTGAKKQTPSFIAGTNDAFYLQQTGFFEDHVNLIPIPIWQWAAPENVVKSHI